MGLFQSGCRSKLSCTGLGDLVYWVGLDRADMDLVFGGTILLD